MATMGLRIGEAIALKRSHVDLASGLLHVRQSRSRGEGDRPLKGRATAEEGRTVPLTDGASQALRAHLAGPVADLGGYVFTAPRGGPIRYTHWLKRMWNRITAEAGVDARPHDLRHSVATRLFVVDRWTPRRFRATSGIATPGSR